MALGGRLSSKHNAIILLTANIPQTESSSKSPHFQNFENTSHCFLSTVVDSSFQILRRATDLDTPFAIYVMELKSDGLRLSLGR
jgi:hypothetical protein